jgi:L-rhamnose mutarotase
MVIADQIKENNIAEYVLYMWQTEDLLRGFKLDIDLVEDNIVNQMSNNQKEKEEIKRWYKQIINDLKIQGKKEKGHCNTINEIIIELNYLHSTLINLMQDGKYSDLYKAALPHIEDFRKRSSETEISDIQLCFNALYGKLILKLKGNNISEDTEVSFNHFRNVLGYLSVKYKKMKAGELNI